MVATLVTSKFEISMNMFHLLSTLDDHLRKFQLYKRGKDLKYFQILNKKHRKGLMVYSLITSQKTKMVCDIQIIVEKSGKPKSLIWSAIEQGLTTVVHTPTYDVIIKTFTSSNNKVQRHSVMICQRPISL